MDKDIRNIILQLEMLLEEYPEGKSYIYSSIKTMVTDLINSVNCVNSLKEEK